MPVFKRFTFTYIITQDKDNIIRAFATVSISIVLPSGLRRLFKEGFFFPSTFPQAGINNNMIVLRCRFVRRLVHKSHGAHQQFGPRLDRSPLVQRPGETKQHGRILDASKVNSRSPEPLHTAQSKTAPAPFPYPRIENTIRDSQV